MYILYTFVSSCLDFIFVRKVEPVANKLLECKEKSKQISLVKNWINGYNRLKIKI